MGPGTTAVIIAFFFKVKNVAPTARDAIGCWLGEQDGSSHFKNYYYSVSSYAGSSLSKNNKQL